ncbi:hypothetical protein JCM18909_1262 [Cutibacterium acnes JCM 18909]|nr:hypothetical protein JCM18909_1262 [Cutibacterium acnes JCM 18909]
MFDIAEAVCPRGFVNRPTNIGRREPHNPDLDYPRHTRSGDGGCCRHCWSFAA